jgi:putative copper resistance protein D
VILLAGFLDVVFRALAFIGLALGVGGVVFQAAVLRPIDRDVRLPDRSLRRSGTLTILGAAIVALSELGALLIAPWSLADENGQWPLRAFLSTSFARAGLLHVLAALGLMAAAVALRSRPRSGGRLVVAITIAALAMASGGPLTHGASRLVHPLLLMTVTVLHQLPSVTWVGGTVHLVAQWRLWRGDGVARERWWPRVVARFSPLAMACVGWLIVAGLYLTWYYVRRPAGLVGTAYGTMLLTKVALMCAALCLGAGNFFSIRQWRLGRGLTALLDRAPVLIETEAAIGLCILLAAAAFTGQPPAVDMGSQVATPREVARAFAPKVPRLVMPPFKAMLAQTTLSSDPYSPPSPLEKLQSDFNHNVAGVFLTLAAVAALLWRGAGVRIGRHWPLAFVPLGLHVLIIGEPTVWPMGPESAWTTLIVPEVLTHRLAAVLAISLAVFEWRVSAGGLGRTRAAYVFPAVCFVGGGLLLGHSHSLFADKYAFLIEVTHNAMGVCAVLVGAARWMELRLPARERRVPGMVWPVCLALIGVTLLFYRET